MKKITFIISSLFISFLVNAQDYEVTFAAFGICTEVDSVQIENISQDKSISVAGTDVLHLLGFVDIEDDSPEYQQLRVYPNPAADYTNVIFYSDASENVEIEIFDVAGKMVLKQTESVYHGNNSFRLSGLKQGMYIVNINSGTNRYNANIVITGSGSGQVEIQAENNGVVHQKSMNLSKSVIQWQYDEGDILVFKGFSGGHSRIYVYYVNSDVILNFEFVLCQDVNGQKYTVTGIGGEVYMSENLRTSKYNNNSPIPEVADNTEWGGLITGGRCYFENDSAQNSLIYGALYNFAAVNTGNLCPIGWHVPTETEWQNLLVYLQNSDYNYTGFVDTDNDYTTNNYISKSLSSTSLWTTTDVTGAPGNTDYLDYRNRSGFSAIGAGMRNPIVGYVSNVERVGKFWSSTIFNEDYAKGLSIQFDVESTNIGNDTKTFGQSVRCIKD